MITHYNEKGKPKKNIEEKIISEVT